MNKSILYVLLICLSCQLVAADLNLLNEGIEDAKSFLNNLLDYQRSEVDLDYPYAGISHYQPGLNEIRISLENGYSKDTVEHEYGHAVIADIYGIFPSYLALQFLGYPSCRKETFYLPYIITPEPHFINYPMSCEAGAFNEGFASAFSAAVRDDESVNGVLLENISLFSKTAEFISPKNTILSPRTEGVTAAILWDIIDDAGSVDHEQPQTDDDELDGKFNMLFQVLNESHPRSILEFYNFWDKKFKDDNNALYQIYEQNGLNKQQRILDVMINPLLKLRDIGPYNDWAHFHHDLRRTGYTTAVSELGKANADQEDFRVKSNLPSTAYDKPTIADIDGDGKMEVIITVNTATQGGIYKLDNGKITETLIDRPIPASATLADLDNDRMKELIFGTDNAEMSPAKYFFYVYGYNINYIDDYEVTGYSLPDGYDLVLDSSAVADIDLDGKPEIIFATYSSASGFQAKLHILDYENKKLIEHQTPITLAHGIGTGYSISVADIQGDSHPEIVIPGRAGLEIYQVNSNGLVSSTPLCTNNDARLVGSAVIADVDKDDDYDIIYATASNSCPTGSSCANKLCKVSNFGTCSSSCTSLTSYPIRTPAVGNLDRDTANDEVVIVTRETTDGTYPGNIRTYNSNLAQIWSYPSIGTIEVFYASPDIANVDNRDYDAEVVVGAGNGRLLILNDDGAEVQNYSVGGEIASDAAIADYDGDGYAEIVVKHMSAMGGVQSMAGGRIVYDREVEDPLYAQTINASFMSMSSYGLDLSLLDAFNKQPQLDYIDEQYAIEGEPLTLEATASDANNDPLTYDYSYPFNGSDDTWHTSIGDEGNYTLLVSVTDGNLTDSQYVSARVFRYTSTFYNQFADAEHNYTQIVDGSSTFTTYANVSNDTKVLLARFKLTGYPANLAKPDYQDDALVINANDIWTDNHYSSYLVDGNWSSYYSAGSETEAIVEQKNLTVPENVKHMVVHLKARIYEGGNGRFGIYNYENNIFELVTSAMPTTNETAQDFYFDIYEGDTIPLWTTNSTHYSMDIEELSTYVNNNSMRWYYDYIGDYASQMLYESEVSFLDEVQYPEDIVVQANGVNKSFTGKLNGNVFAQKKFTNGITKEQYNLTNSSVTRYIKLPKNAELLSAYFKFGSRAYTGYGQVLDDFDNGNVMWDIYKSDPTHQSVSFNSAEDSYSSLYTYTAGIVIPSTTYCSLTSNNSFDIRTANWIEVTTAGNFETQGTQSIASISVLAVDEYNNTQDMFVKISQNAGIVTYPKSSIKIVRDNLTHWVAYQNGVYYSEVNITNLNASTKWTIRLVSQAQRPASEYGIFSYSTANFFKVAYNDINGTLYENLEFCTNWEYTYDGGAIDNIAIGPICADSKTWQQLDVDGDGRLEYYMLTSDTYEMWGWCGVEYEEDSIISDIQFNNISNGCYYGCGDPGDESLYSTNYASPSNINFPSINCIATGSPAGSQYHAGGILKKCYGTTNNSYSYNPNSANDCNGGDVEEPYLALECGRDEDCADAGYCNTSLSNPLNFTCDTPICSPLCGGWETEVYSNHSCSCQVTGGRCDSPNEQYNKTHYCDNSSFLVPILTLMKVNDTAIYSIPRLGFHEADLAPDIQKYLDECIPDEQGLCTIPITFSSEYNTTLKITSFDIDYRIRNIDITTELQDYSHDVCVANCTAPISFYFNGQGNVSINDFKMYRRPYILELSSTLELNDTDDKFKSFQYKIFNTGELDVFNISWNLNNGESIDYGENAFDLNVGDLATFIVNHTYSNNGNYVAVGTAGNDAVTTSANLTFYAGGLLVTQLSEIYLFGTERIFEIKIYNNQETNLTSINWTLDMGDGTEFSAEQLIDLEPEEDVFFYMHYNYSGVGSYNVTMHTFNDDFSDSKSVITKVSFLNVSDLSELYAESNERIYEFNIKSDKMVDADWSFDNGEIIISSNEQITLNQSESVLVFVHYNYTNEGEYTINASAIIDGESDSDITTTEFRWLSIEGLNELYSGVKQKLFEFRIENNRNIALNNVSWNVYTGEELIPSNINMTISNDESVFMYIASNYSNSGAFVANATAKAQQYQDSDSIDITVQ